MELIPTQETLETTLGFRGLLPIPSLNNETELLYDADAADSIDNAETLDQAVILYETIQAENALAQEAAFQIPAAQQELNDKRQNYINAINESNLARKKSDSANLKKDNTVRGVYMSNGVPPIANVIFATDGEAAFRTLFYADQIQIVANFNIKEAMQLEELADSKERETVVALQEFKSAEVFLTQLNQKVEYHTRMAEAAAEAYTEYISREAPIQLEIGTDGCPTSSPSNTLRMGAEEIGVAELCRRSVLQAATPQAALAIKWAFSKLGAPYACKGLGRMGAWRFDCSSLVSRAYAEGAGVRVASTSYAPSTRSMMPWGGHRLDPHFEEVPVDLIAPGDLLLTRSCTQEPCAFQHVTMALSDGFILHTNRCGDFAHVTRNPGYGPEANFVVARRVVFLPGEAIPQRILDAEKERSEQQIFMPEETEEDSINELN
jgi:cell wall-associated NlpC family hydrolase